MSKRINTNNTTGWWERFFIVGKQKNEQMKYQASVRYGQLPVGLSRLRIWDLGTENKGLTFSKEGKPILKNFSILVRNFIEAYHVVWKTYF